MERAKEYSCAHPCAVHYASHEANWCRRIYQPPITTCSIIMDAWKMHVKPVIGAEVQSRLESIAKGLNGLKRPTTQEIVHAASCMLDQKSLALRKLPDSTTLATFFAKVVNAQLRVKPARSTSIAYPHRASTRAPT